MAFNKNKVMDAARKYVEKGQLDRAIKEYLRVVREDPKDVRVWLKIGDLYAKRGAKTDAIETYLKVAKFYSEQGFYLKAVAVYKQILKLNPRLVEVNLKLAELYRQLGLMSDAMQHFEMVAAHFHREGKTKEALATVRQLVDLDPDNIATRIKLAELYSKESMTVEAVTEFRLVCETLRKQGRQDDFIKVAERLLWHDASDLALNRELAGLYLRRGDPRRALQKLQACFKANSRDVETLALLAQAFQALDQKSKTVSVLKELARVLDEDGQRAKAEEVHRKILAYVPNEPDSLAYLGESRRAPMPARSAPARVLSHSDVPAQLHGNPTGSVPLLGEPEELQADFSANSPAVVAELEPEEDLASDLDFDEDGSFDYREGSFAGEAHADEIAKILTETDVYVKYGLHQKAIDHLRRVFDLDPDNIDARERLKDILLSQGRETEAMDELMKLAETAAPVDPDQAEQYLREILAIDASYELAHELARRFRLDLTGAPEVEIVDESGIGIELDGLEGSVEPVDDALEDAIDFEDIDFEDEGIMSSAQPAQVSYGDAFEEEEPFDLELEESPDPSQVTVEVSVDQVEAIHEEVLQEQALAGYGGDELDFDSRPGLGLPPEEGFLEPPPPFDPADAAAFDADRPVEPPPPFDPADARAFDASRQRDHDYLRAGSDPALAMAPDVDLADPAAFDAAPIDEHSFDADFGLEPRPQMPPAVDYLEPSETDIEDVAVDPPAAAPALEPMPPVAFAPDEPALLPPDEPVALEPQVAPDRADDADTAATSLEDDLDEADFFIAQSLYGEARDILTSLLARYPNHPLVTAKLQDVEAMLGAAQDDSTYETEAPHAGATQDAPLELDETDLAVLDIGTDTAEAPVRKPAVLLEKPVDEQDTDTQYDLGMACKEMGLYDQAIAAFENAAHSPQREAQCRLLIGMCHRERGNLSEAIHHFKSGLHAAILTEAEKLGLYYEIGTTYEAVGDPTEALYYYGMVLKKDADYRDVARRMAGIQTVNGRNGASGDAPRARHDDADAAIESLLAEDTGDAHH